MTGKEKLENIDNKIEGLDKKYGLYGIAYCDVVNYVNMTQSEIKSLSVQECSEISFLLVSYSFFLKKQENRCFAISNKLQNEINSIVFKEAKNYCDAKYTKYEEKIYLVSHGNDYVASLKEELDKINFEKDYLQFLSVSIKNISDILTEVKRAKYERNSKCD